MQECKMRGSVFSLQKGYIGMALNKYLSRFSRDLGIDLGTANTLVHVSGKGVLLREPSVVAIDSESGTVLAVGSEAKRMIGRTPGHIVATRPLKDGVIADFDITEAMLRHFIHKVHLRRALVRPRVIISIPSGVTEVERRAVIDATLRAGAREAHLIEEPMAAAIGSGLPISEPMGSMIVDIGGGTTEVAVISLGGIVTSLSIRVAGDEIDEAIVQHIKKSYNVLIGERTAEEIKLEIGTTHPQSEEMTIDIRGRDLFSGLPKSLTVTNSEIRGALSEPVALIIEAVKQTLEKTPPELASDIMKRGIILAGGGALLRGLDILLSEETQVPVYIADDPLTCVAVGAGKALEEIDTLRKALFSSR